MKKITLLVCLTMLASIGLVACQNEPKQPITLTMWHVYGGQTNSPLNDLIDVFNNTIGKEQGIIVQVEAVSNSNNIHKGVLAAVNHEPGAAPLPDIFASYPKTIRAMPDDTLLVDYNDYFEEDELGAFIPAFLNEGIIEDRQLILPVAKSTEIMFVNQTAFDRFAAETGAVVSDMYTWEGLYKLAEEYTAWTDAKTPDIPNDGIPFFVHDYHFNYFQVGVESLDEAFFDDAGVYFSKAFEKVWTPYAKAALEGGVWLKGGYATEALRTGDAIVSVASSASVLYYKNEVTYPDNTSETITFTAHPAPIFEGGESLVMQRGVGMCTVKSTPEREQAAITFLKWLTEPEINTQFVTKAGYMPVTTEAFDTYLKPAIQTVTDPLYQALYQAFLKTQEDYTFYTAPLREDYLDLEMAFEEQVRYHLSAERMQYLSEEQKSRECFVAESMDVFKENYQK